MHGRAGHAQGRVDPARGGGPARFRWLLVALVVAVTSAALVGASGQPRSAHAGSSAPAYGGDFPDPDVLTSAGRYWAYATGSGGRNLQVMHSTDLAGWSRPVDPLPVLPAWARPGYSWAPSVVEVDGRFVLHYTVLRGSDGRQCLSVARSRTPAGPFVDASRGPIVCQAARGGSIDPQVFRSPDGGLYLHWKSDDNALGQTSALWGQQLTDDGLSLRPGRPSRLLTAAAPWHGGIVEGPSMSADGGALHLFYGANDYTTARYAIGHATCQSPLGPCADRSGSAPWLQTDARLVGPGSPAVFRDLDGSTRMAYHAWADDASYEARSGRALWVDTLLLGPDGPSLSGVDGAA